MRPGGRPLPRVVDQHYLAAVLAPPGALDDVAVGLRMVMITEPSGRRTVLTVWPPLPFSTWTWPPSLRKRSSSSCLMTTLPPSLTMIRPSSASTASPSLIAAAEAGRGGGFLPASSVGASVGVFAVCGGFRGGLAAPCLVAGSAGAVASGQPARSATAAVHPHRRPAARPGRRLQPVPARLASPPPRQARTRAPVPSLPPEARPGPRPAPLRQRPRGPPLPAFRRLRREPHPTPALRFRQSAVAPVLRRCRRSRLRRHRLAGGDLGGLQVLQRLGQRLARIADTLPRRHRLPQRLARGFDVLLGERDRIGRLGRGGSLGLGRLGKPEPGLVVGRCRQRSRSAGRSPRREANVLIEAHEFVPRRSGPRRRTSFRLPSNRDRIPASGCLPAHSEYPAKARPEEGRPVTATPAMAQRSGPVAIGVSSRPPHSVHEPS